MGLSVADLDEIPLWMLSEAMDVRMESSGTNANIREATQADFDNF